MSDVDRGSDLPEPSSVLRRVSDGVVSLDEEFRYTYVNERAERLLGTDADELVGTDVWEQFPEAADSVAREKFEEAMETQQRVSYERYNEVRDQWFEVQVYPDSEGLSVFFRDVTDRKERDRRLERYEWVVENLPVAVGQVEPSAEGTFSYVNEEMVELFDADSKAELKEHTPTDAYVDPDRRAELEEAIRQEGQIEGFELELETFSGEQFRGQVTVTAETVDGERHFLGIVEDVTEQTGKDRALREANRRLNAIVEATDEAIYLKDLDGRYRLVNEAAAALFGVEPETMVGKRDADLFDGDQGDDILLTDDRVVESGESVDEETVRIIDGERHVFRSEKYPYYDEGEITGVIGVTRDVTDEKERVRRFEQAETLFQNAQDALFLVDVEEGGQRYRLERVNPTYEGLTGLTNEQLGGQTIREAFDDDDAANIRTRYDDVVEREEAIEYEERLSVPEPGSYWETRVAPVVVDGEVEQLVGATRNVTDRKRREQQLQETRKTLKAIFDNSPDAVVMVDEDRQVTRWNRAAEEMFGWTEDEILGRHAPFVPEEKTAEFETFVDALDDGETKRGVRTVRRRKDGERIDVRLSSTKVTVDDELVGYMATFEDIGQQLAYERRLERQRDDLELLTQMMSHDIRNDLEVVLGYAELLERDLEGDRRRYADEVVSSARTAVDLTQSARDLAAAMRRTDRDRQPTPLKGTLESQLEQVRSAYRTATVTVDGDVPAETVLADEMLSSVFRNLLKNAVQHNDEAVPEVTVSVDVGEDTVTVSVADNGPGIPAEMRDDLFGRGEKGLDSEGTGIGLYLVDTLVDQYDGAVRTTDNEPKGTVFTVELERA